MSGTLCHGILAGSPVQRVLLDDWSLIHKFRMSGIYSALAGTVAGEYTGNIIFTISAKGEIRQYKITVNVLPFVLENTPLEYSLYYRVALTAAGTGTISSESKNTELVQFPHIRGRKNIIRGCRNSNNTAPQRKEQDIAAMQRNFSL